MEELCSEKNKSENACGVFPLRIEMCSNMRGNLSLPPKILQLFDFEHICLHLCLLAINKHYNKTVITSSMGIEIPHHRTLGSAGGAGRLHMHA